MTTSQPTTDSVIIHDAIVIGTGCVGAATAMQLSKISAIKSLLVLEAELECCQGASKANSGIVHGGYDAKPGSLKAKLGVKGNALFPLWCKELNIPLNLCGSLVLSFTDRDDQVLDSLQRNAEANGVPVEMWTASQVLEDQPHISVGVRGGLFCKQAGVVSPYNFTIAMCESAALNGAKFLLGRRVMRVVRSAEHEHVYQIECIHTTTGLVERYLSKRIVNAAGMGADEIAAPFNYLSSFQIRPRRGEYLLLSKQQGLLVSRVIFQAPTERYGKGVLVTRTIDGNLLVGPTSTNQKSRTDKSTTMQELAYVAWASRRSVPHLDTREAFRSFAGIRTKSSTEDFVIENRDGYILLAGIESPGLSSSPAIAELVLELLLLDRAPKKSASEVVIRKHYELGGEPLGEGAAVGHPDPSLNIVCQCEEVVEATVVSAVRAEPRPCTPDGVKWRVRCGMGPCQGARCKERTEKILDRELGANRPVPSKPLDSVRVSRNNLARL